MGTSGNVTLGKMGYLVNLLWVTWVTMGTSEIFDKLINNNLRGEANDKMINGLFVSAQVILNSVYQ